MSEYNDSSKTTGFQVLFAILGALIAPVLVIVLILKLFMGFQSTAPEDEKATVAEVTKQVEPIAQVEVAVVSNVAHVDKGGEEVYNAVCTMCHAAGLLNAPKFGDKGQWAPRIAQGYETLVSHAINGIRSMPARGGNADLTDGEVANAVAYMANASGANFTAPVAGAPTVVAAVATTDTAAAVPVAAGQPAMPSVAASASAPAAIVAVSAKAKGGEEVYKAVCSMCHAAGLLNAPKFGDKAAWAPRIAQGQSTLVQHAINGIRSMPARGGNAELTDAEVGNAVAYMVAKASGGKVADKSSETANVKSVDAQKTDVQKEVASVASTPEAANAATTAPVVVAAAPVVEEEEEKPEPTNYSGPKVYGMVCSACHGSGLAGAPKLGDAAAWAPRIAQGYETLVSHAVNGIRAMPAKGGNPNLSDVEVARAVAHMANKQALMLRHLTRVLRIKVL